MTSPPRTRSVGERGRPADALTASRRSARRRTSPISDLRSLPAVRGRRRLDRARRGRTHKETGASEPSLADAIVKRPTRSRAASDRSGARTYQGARDQRQHERKRGPGRPGQRAARQAPRRLHPVRPNDHVDMAQSTDDVELTGAMRLAVLATLPVTLAALDTLAASFWPRRRVRRRHQEVRPDPTGRMRRHRWAGVQRLRAHGPAPPRETGAGEPTGCAT